MFVRHPQSTCRPRNAILSADSSAEAEGAKVEVCRGGRRRIDSNSAETRTAPSASKNPHTKTAPEPKRHKFRLHDRRPVRALAISTGGQSARIRVRALLGARKDKCEQLQQNEHLRDGRDANPFRIRTYKIAFCKSSRMNTYTKQGQGVAALCCAAAWAVRATNRAVGTIVGLGPMFAGLDKGSPAPPPNYDLIAAVILRRTSPLGGT